MADEGFKRKLTAILSADAVGYSRLMGEDEAATVSTITSYRNVISTLIKQHNGTVIDSPGDNLLAEFVSVVDAVQCAVAVQKEISARNIGFPENRRMQFRIGINLGDVIQEGGRIYGDGVNIAARLEGLAEPGGICISKTAFDHIESKLPYGYEFLGDQTVKNIAKPVGAYRVQLDPRVTVSGEPVDKKPAVIRRTPILVGAVVVLVLVFVVGVWQFYVRRPSVEPASVEKMAFPLPDKPSIAVLPFDNLSKDQSDAYIADGLSENIISSLSKIPNLLVIARNSTFVYKGKAVKVNQVAEELGVRYVLEGSVQKSGDKIRVIAQLIDAVSGHHLWSEKYDREIENFFQLLDEITLKISDALGVKLLWGGDVRIVSTNSFEAWSYLVKGNHHFSRFTKQDNIKARELCKQAIKLDPEYVDAWIVLAWTHFSDARNGFTDTPLESTKQAVLTAQKASAIDDKVSTLQTLWGTLYLLQRQHEKAIAAGQKSIELDPNNADGYALLAQTMYYSGRSDETITLMQQAMRLSPYPPAYFLAFMGWGYQGAGHYQEAVSVFEKLLDRAQEGEYNFLHAHLLLAGNYGAMGEFVKAREHGAEVLKIYPDASLEWIRSLNFFKDPDQLERLLDAYRAAGLPEHPPLKLPDKPSIAVLPFDNMSKDPEQEYFADGMTDDLITDLSKIVGLFVIARNSAFQYKGKAVDVKKVSRELGIRYVLEGSVRRVGDKVRINAQLIDASTGGHMWAERYDEQMEDIFSLQDKITQKIVAALAVELTTGEKENIASKGTDNIEAYDAFLKGWQHYLRYTPEECAIAIKYITKAVKLDPNYGQAHAALALIYYSTAGAGKEWEKALQANFFTARIKARYFLNMAMKSPNSLAYRVASIMNLKRRRHEDALRNAQKATIINPNDADSQYAMASVLVYSGSPKEGMDVAKKVMQLDPSKMDDCLYLLGIANFCLGQYEAAIASFERALKYNPSMWVNNWFAVSYWNLNRKKEAKAAFEKYEKRWLKAVESELAITKFDLQLPVYEYPFNDIKTTERFVDGMIKAGNLEPQPYYEAERKNKLTGDEIKDLVFGRTETGSLSGATWTIKFEKDGNAVWDGYGFKDNGKWWVEGDQLCQKWNSFFGEGLTYYSDIYRNPEGSLEEINQYIRITDFNMYAASYIE